MSVLDGFFSTWSNAKATFGEGTPQTGDQFDGSAALGQAQSTLDSAAPGSWWTGSASTAYGAANTNHQRVIGEIGALDKTLAEQVNKSAEVVANGRTQLDAVRQWVVDAAASVPPGKNRDQLLLPIANKGVGDVMGIVQKTNSELGTIGSAIQGLTGKYDKLAGETFVPKEDKPEIQGVKDEEEKKKEEDVRKRAEQDVQEALAGDPAAAGRVEDVIGSIKPGQELSAEQGSYLSQMQAQQNGMTVDELKTAEQRLGDHKDIIVTGKGDEKNPEEEKQLAADKVREALEGDPAAAAEVDRVLDSITDEQLSGKKDLSIEQQQILSQMGYQTHDKSLKDLTAIRDKLGDHKGILADSWQVLSDPDVKVPETTNFTELYPELGNPPVPGT